MTADLLPSPELVVLVPPVCPDGCGTVGYALYDPSIGNWPFEGNTMMLGIVIPGVAGAAYYECGVCSIRFARYPYGHPVQLAAEAYWDDKDEHVELVVCTRTGRSVPQQPNFLNLGW